MDSSPVHNIDVAKSFEAAAFQFYMVADVCHVTSYWQGKNKTNKFFVILADQRHCATYMYTRKHGTQRAQHDRYIVHAAGHVNVLMLVSPLQHDSTTWQKSAAVILWAITR